MFANFRGVKERSEKERRVLQGAQGAWLIVGIIPSRFAATRFPGKPLVDLEGKTMLQRVYEGARQCSLFDRIIIATDDGRIVHEADRIGAEVVVTPADIPSGTDRCNAALQALQLKPNIVVNIQGDEPLLQGSVLTDLIHAVRADNVDVSTPICAIRSPKVLLDPSTVKVVVGSGGRAVYFSRSVIPFVRDVNPLQWFNEQRFWKHIGLYAYKYEALQRHCALPVAPLEKAESLEQLRLLEQGAWFQCVETTQEFISVDTPEDAENVRRHLRKLE